MRYILSVLCVMCSVSAAPSPRPVEVDRWFLNGRLQSREFYLDGRKVGHHETWWPSGLLRTSASYLDDTLHGERRTWREDGHPYELRHFDHGREAGLQQSWNDDGSLYLNYEVRNGRRFGFINAVPCLPADEDGRPVKGATP